MVICLLNTYPMLVAGKKDLAAHFENAPPIERFEPNTVNLAIDMIVIIFRSKKMYSRPCRRALLDIAGRSDLLQCSRK